MNLVALQVAIATTGTPQNLPNIPVVNSITVTAKSTNTANVANSASPTETATTGYLLEKGLSVQIPLREGNLNDIWIDGTTADVISVIGS